jgi:CRISPR-associated endonuclease/helicase Cas3
MPHFAHSLKDRPQSEWHRLDQHLETTSARAELFASSFAKQWGKLAGLLHDAGKYQQAFQDYLAATKDHTGPKVDHSIVGALIAKNQNAGPLCFVIAGHHAGLADKQDLLARLEKKDSLLDDARNSGLPPALETFANPPVPKGLSKTAQALWIRFLFSALIDADRLDTESFFENAERDIPPADLQSLSTRLDYYLDSKISESDPTPVNLLRARVLKDCRDAAVLPKGLFTLTVPTGGGKTLSSLSFALRHAVKHNLRRVILVVPFTSIIDQTAKTYRDILGDDAIIEHHSNLDPDKETLANQTACENWDAGIIVTTSVQFFESLYANKTSRCRKLHRIADSVVVFDEVQTFEPTLLEPIKEVLRNLAGHFGISAVFCTATQPTLDLGSTEIITDPAREFEVVRNRYRIRMPESPEPTPWDQIAAELRNEHQALAIVDRRADAEELAKLVGESCIHLSARMCPAHRLATILRIKAILKAREKPCIVISTQLIEAGVDLDFPIVYRAFAGAGSMAQAAGRCNREGTRSDGGELRIFFPVKPPPRGILRIGAQRAETLWKEGKLDLTSPATFHEYYRRLYNSLERDPGVLAAEKDLCFKQSAELFKMIEQPGVQIVAPYGDSEEKLRQIDFSGITRKAMRRLQPFLVTLYPQEIETLRRAGAIIPIAKDCEVWRVLPNFKHAYDPIFGFQWQGPLAAEPESLIA